MAKKKLIQENIQQTQTRAKFVGSVNKWYSPLQISYNSTTCTLDITASDKKNEELLAPLFKKYGFKNSASFEWVDDKKLPNKVYSFVAEAYALKLKAEVKEELAQLEEKQKQTVKAYVDALNEANATLNKIGICIDQIDVFKPNQQFAGFLEGQGLKIESHTTDSKSSRNEEMQDQNKGVIEALNKILENYCTEQTEITIDQPDKNQDTENLRISRLKDRIDLMDESGFWYWEVRMLFKGVTLDRLKMHTHPDATSLSCNLHAESQITGKSNLEMIYQNAEQILATKVSERAQDYADVALVSPKQIKDKLQEKYKELLGKFAKETNGPHSADPGTDIENARTTGPKGRSAAKPRT